MSKSKNKKMLMKRIRDELNLAAHGWGPRFPSEEDRAAGAWLWSSLTGVLVGSPYPLEQLLEAPRLGVREGKNGGKEIYPEGQE